jgi:hypothetical protein
LWSIFAAIRREPSSNGWKFDRADGLEPGIDAQPQIVVNSRFYPARTVQKPMPGATSMGSSTSATAPRTRPSHPGPTSTRAQARLGPAHHTPDRPRHERRSVEQRAQVHRKEDGDGGLCL